MQIYVLPLGGYPSSIQGNERRESDIELGVGTHSDLFLIIDDPTLCWAQNFRENSDDRDHRPDKDQGTK